MKSLVAYYGATLHDVQYVGAGWPCPYPQAHGAGAVASLLEAQFSVTVVKAHSLNARARAGGGAAGRSGRSSVILLHSYFVGARVGVHGKAAARLKGKVIADSSGAAAVSGRDGDGAAPTTSFYTERAIGP